MTAAQQAVATAMASSGVTTSSGSTPEVKVIDSVSLNTSSKSESTI
jgi:hypothetical protein